MSALDELVSLVPPPADPPPAIDEGIEQPYAPERLLPWGIDEGGNVVWWLMEGDWPVVANEARGDEWHRHDGGAAGFLAAILSGRETSDFLVIGGR